MTSITERLRAYLHNSNSDSPDATIPVSQQDLWEAEREIDALHAALEKHGWHRGGCAYHHVHPEGYHDPQPCTCGYDAALGLDRSDA